MDVLEYWHMNTDHCTLTDAEDAIQGRTAEDIVVHVSLRKNILVEFLRRALILSFLDEVPWFQHVPEEFFDRALAVAEDDDWELGIAEGVNPWPSMGHEGYHTDTRLAKSWIIYNTRARSVAERVPVAEYVDIVENQAPWDDMFDERVKVLEEWERTHWMVLNRNVDVTTLPPPERKRFRTEAAFWRHTRKPCVWIPMDPEAHKILRTQLDILDQREPSRLYWGSSCPEERVAEGVSPAVWGTRVTIHANRLPVPEPEEYVMPRGRR
ncbi:hypothetical protein PHMEG_00032554, partial [Phytophthora megakarya]